MDMDSATFNPLPASAESDLLALVDWPGLVARLGAERDLRRELAARAAAATTFSDGAAAVFDCAFPQSCREPGINPAALANGKAHEGITPVDEDTVPSAGNDARGLE